MSSLTISKNFFFIPKVCPHSPLSFVCSSLFFFNRCPHSPDPFSLIVFCFSLQRISSLTISKDFFFIPKVCPHSPLSFVYSSLFFLNRCPHSLDPFSLMVFCFSLKRMS